MYISNRIRLRWSRARNYKLIVSQFIFDLLSAVPTDYQLHAMVRLKEIFGVCVCLHSWIALALRVPPSPQRPLLLPQEESMETVPKV
jgi:hypothetical protein